MQQKYAATTFSESSDRVVTVECNYQACPLSPGLGEVSHMSAMKQVKDAIGEDQWPGQLI